MSSSVLKNVIQPKLQTIRIIQPAEENSLQAKPIQSRQESPAPSDTGDDMHAILGAMVENAPVAMAIFDRGMRYMLANRQWLREFGLQHVQPITGRSQYEIFPNLHPGWRQVYERALQGHIVRSEHDADGRRVIYRWEVRPWRRHSDASVGGLMVTCEKFNTGAVPAESDEHDAAAESQEAPKSAAPVQPDPFDCSLAIAAAHLVLDKGIAEGKTTFWDAYNSAADAPRLRQQYAEVCAAHEQDRDAAPQMISTRRNGSGEQRWLVSAVHPSKRQSEGAAQTLFTALCVPESVIPAAKPAPKPEHVLMAAMAPVASPVAPPRELTENLQNLERELSRAKQELRTMLEAERGFVKRESRLRSFLEAAPCGLFVLDERGTPIYQNEQVAKMLGRPIDKETGVEAWLAAACPTAEHREHVAVAWRESVWRRQLTRTVSLATADGLLKEIEFHPVALPGGSLLVSIQDVTEGCRHEEQLRGLEAKFRALLHSDPAAIVLTDKTGVIFEVNPHAELLLGQPKSELRRYPLDAWLEPESAMMRREALRALHGHEALPEPLTVRVKRADGSGEDARMHLALVLDGEGEPHCTLHYFQAPVAVPIEAPMAEKVAETASQVPEAASVLDFAPPPFLAPRADFSTSEVKVPAEPIYVERTIPITETLTVDLLACDANGRITAWSEHARDIFDIDAATATGRPLHLLFRPSDATGFFFALAGQAATPEVEIEHSYFGAQGRGSMPLSVSAREEGGYYLRTRREITRYETVQELVAPAEPVAMPMDTAPRLEPQRSGAMAFQLVAAPSHPWPVADLEREKLMLSETHHRIKNHLQIISSLLNMQINGVSDQHARDALRASQNRVRAIAALHQHLHQVAMGGAVTFSGFVHELVEHLRDCYQTRAEQVEVRLDIEDGDLQPEWHMPLALTLNEALSNSFEHAFPHGRRGCIHATLQYLDGLGELVVRDDGTGLAPGFHPTESQGLGLKILAVFADQMRGQLFIQGAPDGGTEVRLRFPVGRKN
ncbi:MAG: PAS domain S-box protein [Verrucomicrobiaceae bacterium]|nr:PAS domain S-box protein [Verrucomicrobiaceae bacterium]